MRRRDSGVNLSQEGVHVPPRFAGSISNLMKLTSTLLIMIWLRTDNLTVVRKEGFSSYLVSCIMLDMQSAQCGSSRTASRTTIHAKESLDGFAGSRLLPKRSRSTSRTSCRATSSRRLSPHWRSSRSTRTERRTNQHSLSGNPPSSMPR